MVMITLQSSVVNNFNTPLDCKLWLGFEEITCRKSPKGTGQAHLKMPNFILDGCHG